MIVGSGDRPQTAWDGSVNLFKTIVDLAETLPIQQPHVIPLSRRSISPTSPPTESTANRPIVPKPTNTSSLTPPGVFETVFRLECPLSSEQNIIHQRTPASFSPSFELTPILPMFLVATRCRDPLVRRRAIALLLNFRRREGVWDSLSAGSVAVQWLRQEEDLGEFELPSDNWVPFTPSCQQCKDIPEGRRVRDVRISVNMEREVVSIAYTKINGTEWVEQRNAYEVGLSLAGVADPTFRATD